MQLSETITIYLAIGAPFGVNFFLREQAGKGRARSVFKATGACLLWPLVALASFLARERTAHGVGPRATTDAAESTIDERTSFKIAAAERQLFAALERVRELGQATADKSEDLEQNVRAAREGIEKYVGLTLALAEARPDAQPAEREMELCRIAGRTGDDLLLAGRCIHRRNVMRLVTHQARSRTELLHNLAAVREIGNERLHASAQDATAARHLSVAVLRFYGQAINLLSLLEDETAAMQASRLLDAECARLRRLEALRVGVDKTAVVNGKHALHNYGDSATLVRQ
jgi:hypothetical protein